MKRIDRYIITSFLTTFTAVFVILFCIFILYALWLFIPDLAGKGLSVWMVVKFLSYVMPTLVPVILPLTILLSSIMTFGTFGENYEFAAMKSAGMSLSRISRGLVFFILILSGIAFFFANEIIPYSKYKVQTFRSNVKDKPSLAIAEGQFNDLGNYNIKVNKKSGEDDRFLEGVVIHKKSNYGKNTTVTKAKTGELISKDDSNILQLVLYDGHHYEDIVPKNFEERRRNPFLKGDFDKYVINIDLSGLMNVNLDSDNGEGADDLLNVSELKYTIDSLRVAYQGEVKSFLDNIHNRVTTIIHPTEDIIKLVKDSTGVVENEFKGDLLSIVPINQRNQLYENAYNNMMGIKYLIVDNKYNLEFKNKNIKSHEFSMYEKFAIAYGCLLMFFIGAPLGAIIRKGGFGMPIVFAMIIFVAYHFSTTFGRKVAQDGTLDAFLGAFGSALILTPLAIVLTYRATNDKGMSLDRYTQPVLDFFKRIFKNKKDIQNV